MNEINFIIKLSQIITWFNEAIEKNEVGNYGANQHSPLTFRELKTHAFL